ncbi:MAG: MBL fold metallo-hydrolase [Chloroflexota bacterium]
MSIRKVKGRILVAETEYMGANLSCIDTKEGLVLIDTPYLLDDIKKWKENIAKFSNNKKIAYVINTDFHFDHCMANTLLCPTVVGHDLTYARMLKPDGTGRQFFLASNQMISPELKQQVYDMPLGLPRLTFSDRMGLHLGDASLELVHMGGHTEATIAIYLVEDKVLFSGDTVVANMHPYKGDADFKQWMAALDRVLKMDIDVIVPGHGSICGKPEATRLLEYFHEMWGRVSDLRKQGCSRDEVVKGVHSMIDYFPVDPARVEQTNMMFDEGTARMYEQVVPS